VHFNSRFSWRGYLPSVRSQDSYRVADMRQLVRVDEAPYRFRDRVAHALVEAG
jgi:hypothetical protein